MPAPPTTIASRSNPRVKQLRGAFAGHARLSGGLIAIEGEHLLFEAMRSGLAFKAIFLSERASAPRWTPRSVELIQLSDVVFASVADTQTPQGIAALLVPPTWTMDDVFSGKLSGSAALVLVAAGLQDPGNLGTLVRSAEAFGAGGVLTTAGTVSEWNQKAIRASAGSIFRMPVVNASTAELFALKARGVRLLAAVADDPLAEKAVAVDEADLTGACAVMIGNEGAGLPDELLALADVRVTIPTRERIESLNAGIAGSLLLYEAARQRGGKAAGG